MKRKDQKENTRARVLLAARTCIANRDVRDVSMLELAQSAGVSVGALYVHFDNREALIDAIVGELQSELVASFRSTLLAIAEASVPLAVHHLATAFVTAIEEFRPYLSLYASHSARMTSVAVLRTSGAAAPLVQMVNATLGSLLSPDVRLDLPFFAASLLSVWRAAALSQSARPRTDAALVARSLAEVTLAILEKGCPEVLTRDARHVARSMAQFLR